MNAADPRERVEEFGYAFEGVVFALNRNQQRLCGGQRVKSEQVKRWRTVNDDVIVVSFDGCECVLQPEFSLLNFDELDFRSRQIFIRRGPL
jgi:hypothetical protein